MNRRRFVIRTSAALTGGWFGATSFPWGECQAQSEEITKPRSASAAATSAVIVPRYRIGVCDWMMLKRQKLGAFPLAREIGADGVEVDMGELGNRDTFDNRLKDPEVRRQFLDQASQLQLSICSLAMSGFYAQSFAERATTLQMVQDCIDTMKLIGVKTAFLPLGVRGDLVKHPELRGPIVERLRNIGSKAREAGVIIGLETSLDAAGEVELLRQIESPAIRIYFNFANALQAGRDLLAELRTLGPERICQIHCTDEDGVWLQDNARLDLRKVKAVLDEMKWSGWLVVERSRDAKDPRNVKRNFGANVKFLKSIFQGME
jgi:sugar phosphate isomerase/epimerase